MGTPRRALVVVDVQNEYFDGIFRIQHPAPEAALDNVVRAIDIAMEAGLPVVVVQHALPGEAPVFAAGSTGQALHPEVDKRSSESWKRATKNRGSVFAGTDVADFLAQHDVDTISIVGFMTNNCDIATAAAAEGMGLSAEILSDASGAIHLVNDAGAVAAEDLHKTLMVLLHSNFAAVATTDEWAAAVAGATALPKSDLGTSAYQGQATFASF